MAGNDKMWVIATKRGYYGDQIREPKKAGGKPFEIDGKDQFSKNWMKQVKAPVVKEED